MYVAKMFKKAEEHIVEVMTVGEVKFAPGTWVLVRDLDKPWHYAEMYWVHPDEVKFDWIREFVA